jgi:hypothetical protein
MGFTIQGNAGVAGALVTLSGAASSSVTADSTGNYEFSNLAAGSYTVTPTLAGCTFAPLSASKTIGTANILGVNFVATLTSISAGVVSTQDCRASGANSSLNLNGTALNIVSNPPSDLLPIDSRAAGIVQDSRVTKPLNSRL